MFARFPDPIEDVLKKIEKTVHKELCGLAEVHLGQSCNGHEAIIVYLKDRRQIDRAMDVLTKVAVYDGGYERNEEPIFECGCQMIVIRTPDAFSDLSVPRKNPRR